MAAEVAYGPYPARVVAIHDGDTITFDIDLGFGIRLPGQSWAGKTMLACRVYGINAPELSTAEGKAALAYARTLLAPGDLCAGDLPRVGQIRWPVRRDHHPARRPGLRRPDARRGTRGPVHRNLTP